MSLDGATWERMNFRTWALRFADGTAAAVVWQPEGAPTYRVKVRREGQQVTAACDRPGMDAAMQMAGEALFR